MHKHACRIAIAALALVLAWPTEAGQRDLSPPRGDANRGGRGPVVDSDAGCMAREADDNFGFGLHLAGTFLGELLADEGEESFFHFVLTLHADGTAETADSGDNLFGYESPSFGVWRRTGARQVTVRQVYLRYDSFGSLTLFGRDTLVVDFDESLHTATGRVTGEALSPSEILLSLDPNGGEPALSSTSRLRMTRVESDVPWGSRDGNDVPEVAMPIDCPSFTTSGAAIETFDDVDFYRIEGTPGQPVQIDIDTVPGQSRLDTILGTFDSDLLGVAASDDDPAPGESLTFDSYVATTFPDDGVLYIAVAPFVFPYQFHGPGYSFGPYTMNVDCGTNAWPASTVDRNLSVPEPRTVPRAGKPAARFQDRYTPDFPTPADSFGQAKKMAGTYLAVETGFFGTLYEIVSFHLDGTFSVQFEGSQQSSAEAVRGECRRGVRHLLICEGMDRLISTSGQTVLFDRISWVFDFDPALEAPRGYQVAQELFRAPAMLNPPRPNLGILDDDFVAFGFGNEIPQMRRIDTAVEHHGKKRGTTNLGFGKRVAGVFLGVVSEDGQPPGEFFLARLGADGTLLVSETSDYLFGQIDGAARGAWERTGPRGIATRSMGFLAGGDVVRNTLEVAFSDDLQRASGALTREFFLRSQVVDPLDPNTDAPPAETRWLRFSMTRLVNGEEDAGE